MLFSDPEPGANLSGNPSSLKQRVRAALLGSLPSNRTWISIDIDRVRFALVEERSIEHNRNKIKSCRPRDNN